MGRKKYELLRKLLKNKSIIKNKSMIREASERYFEKYIKR